MCVCFVAEWRCCPVVFFRSMGCRRQTLEATAARQQTSAAAGGAQKAPSQSPQVCQTAPVCDISSHNHFILPAGTAFSNSPLPSLPQPPAPSSSTGHASLLGHRIFQCHCTKMPSWSAWPRAIPDPSSPGAVQTASLLMFTTLKCWETVTSSSRTSSPSMEECTCAEPPPLEHETIP